MNRPDNGADPDAATSYQVRLTARAAAEPHVLASWSEQSEHPRLKEAYVALQERVRERAVRIPAALVEANPATRGAIARAVEEETALATGTTFEPSRLKWLLAARRDRLNHDDLPGYRNHREQDQEEADQLEALLERVLRTMC